MRWWKKDEKKADENAITLSDVIRGIQYCVNSSIEIVEQHYVNALQKYMTEDEKIRMERIQLDDAHYMDIPLICLTGHNALEIEKMKIKMKVNIRDMALKQAMKGGNGAEYESAAPMPEEALVSRSSMMVDICNISRENDGTNMEIQMTFKTSDPPEALSRMIETLNNSIAVKVKESLT